MFYIKTPVLPPPSSSSSFFKGRAGRHPLPPTPSLLHCPFPVTGVWNQTDIGSNYQRASAVHSLCASRQVSYLSKPRVLHLRNAYKDDIMYVKNSAQSLAPRAQECELCSAEGNLGLNLTLLWPSITVSGRAQLGWFLDRSWGREGNPRWTDSEALLLS